MALRLLQRKHSVLAQTPPLLNPIVSRAPLPFKWLRSTQGNSPPHLNGGLALTQCVGSKEPGFCPHICVETYQDTGRLTKTPWLALRPEMTIGRGLQSPIPTLTKFPGTRIFDHKHMDAGVHESVICAPSLAAGATLNTSILVKCKNSRPSHLWESDQKLPSLASGRHTAIRGTLTRTRSISGLLSMKVQILGLSSSHIPCTS